MLDTHTIPCSNMKELLSKVEVWEKAGGGHEADYRVRWDVDLKLGALMKMLPSKELEMVKLKYVENEAGLTYNVLRRQVEF